MAYPILPTGKIPYPVRDNYTQQYQQKQKRIPMDDGQGRVRRKYLSQPLDNNLQWVLTWEQYANFEAFLRWDCAHGAGWFQMAIVPGGPLQTLRFKQYPKASFDANRNSWSFRGSVEYIQNVATRTSNFTSLPIWPTSLPEPEKQSYTISRDEEFARSNPDDGLATQRSRFDQSLATYDVNWKLDADQLNTLLSFVHNELLDGNSFFQGPFVNGLGVFNSRCRFVNLPVASATGATYEVRATLETTDIPFIPYFEWEDLGNVNLFDTTSVVDAVGILFKRAPLVESITTTEVIKIFVNKRTFETITVSDALSTVSNDKRTSNESIATADQVNYNLRLGAKTESVTTTGTGSVTWNDYCDGDYCNDDYVGTTSTF